ncbi:MAG: GNAT family N-acetyltransferase [Firmicutes bacterium]|nr:GNAT family N-acetyltransferase [Bacillota bacterium]
MAVRPVRADDVPAVALIFRKAFPESVAHVYGGIDPPDEGLRDIFRFLAGELPDNFLVWEESGRISGYVVAPRTISMLWARALLRGHLLVWARKWLCGAYRLSIFKVLKLIGNKILFAGSSLRQLAGRHAQILSVAVDPESQGRGIGRALTAAALQLLRTQGAPVVKLEVRPWNIPARRVYSSLGFQEVGRSFDSQGEWLMMEARLSADSATVNTLGGPADDRSVRD